MTFSTGSKRLDAGFRPARLAGMCGLAAVSALAACQLALPFGDFDNGGSSAPDASSSDAALPDAADAATVDATPCTLATGRNSPAEIVVDDSFAYWVEFAADGGVFRVAKDDCSGDAAVQTLASNFPYPADLAIDDDSVYWVNESPFAGDGTGSLMTVAKDGGTPVTLATSLSFPNRVVVDDARAYFTEATPTGTVSSVAKDGSGGKTVNVSNLVNPGGLAIDDTLVYFTTEGDDTRTPTHAGVWSAPKTCAAPTSCAVLYTSSVADPFVLRLSGGRLFFSQHASGTSAPGSVFTLAADAGAGVVPTELTATRFTAERLGIAADGLQVYVAQNVETGGTVTVDTFSLDATGLQQNSRPIADGLESPQGVTVDTSFVYFTTFDGGQIWRAAR